MEGESIDTSYHTGKAGDDEQVREIVIFGPKEVVAGQSVNRDSDQEDECYQVFHKFLFT